jgi:hypothetical protein
MDGPRLSRIGIKPEGFYFIARIPKKNEAKKIEKSFGVKMAHPGFPVSNLLDKSFIF